MILAVVPNLDYLFIRELGEVMVLATHLSENIDRMSFIFSASAANQVVWMIVSLISPPVIDFHAFWNVFIVKPRPNGSVCQNMVLNTCVWIAEVDH